MSCEAPSPESLTRATSAANKSDLYRRTTLTVAFFGFGLMTALIQLMPVSNTLDYPISVISGMRTAAGEKPYVDFDVLYGPVGPYLTAAWMTLFSSLRPTTAFNLLTLTTTLALLGGLYRAIRKADLEGGGPPVRALTWMSILYLAAMLPVMAQLGYYSILPTSLFIVAAWLVELIYSNALEPRGQLAAEIALAFVGATSVFLRFNFGAYIFFAVGLTALAAVVLRRPRAVVTLVRLALFAAAGIGLYLVVLETAGILGAYVTDMEIYLPRFKNRHKPLSYTPWSRLLPIAAVAVLVVGWTAKLLAHRRVGGALFLCFLAAPLTHYMFVRFDDQHFLPLAVVLPYLLAFSYPLTNVPAASSGFTGWRRLTLGPAATFTATILVLLLPARLGARGSLGVVQRTAAYWTGQGTLGLVERNGLLLLPEEDAMLTDLGVRLQSQDPIYWGGVPGSCEHTMHAGVNLGLYLAAGRVPTARTWFWDTPSTVYADVQERIVKQLEQEQTPWIGVQGMINEEFPHAAGTPREATVFYDYVRAHYRLVKRFDLPGVNRYYLIYRYGAAS